MKRCNKCQSMYQGNSCECGFAENKKPRYTTQDEWLQKRHEEVNGWMSQIERLHGIIEHIESPIARDCACTLLAIAETNLKDAKRRCGTKLDDVLKTPGHLQCKGYHPENGDCSKIGTISHLGSDSWFCIEHHLK